MATVLIVDDDADNCDMLARLLGRDGHTALCASDGKQAIDILTQRNPALILLDMRMPTMNGIEFLQVIRSYLRWQALPVIVVSGVPDEHRERAATLGVRHVLQKGTGDFAALRAAVRAELAAAPGAARLEK